MYDSNSTTQLITSLRSSVLGLSLESLADRLGGNVRVLDIVQPRNSPEGRHNEDAICNIN